MLRERRRRRRRRRKERNSERKNYIIRLCKTKRVLVSIVERIKGSKKRARRSAEGDRVWKLVPQSSARWQERLAPSLRAAHGHFQGFTPETLVSPLIDSSWHVFSKRRRPMTIQNFPQKEQLVTATPPSQGWPSNLFQNVRRRRRVATQTEN